MLQIWKVAQKLRSNLWAALTYYQGHSWFAQNISFTPKASWVIQQLTQLPVTNITLLLQPFKFSFVQRSNKLPMEQYVKCGRILVLNMCSFAFSGVKFFIVRRTPIFWLALTLRTLRCLNILHINYFIYFTSFHSSREIWTQ